jgi:cob(I)alamin adenosyltransferase
MSGKIKVYTRTGDSGTSSLFTGERRAKTDPAFDALGNVDELNSLIGLCRATCRHAELLKQLEWIQFMLFDLGSHLATPLSSANKAKLARAEFPSDASAQLERYIDQMEERLPPLRNFILPGGSMGSSYLHVARSVCRRAERSACPLRDEGDIDAAALVFLNRLSDYLFVSARFENSEQGIADVIYKKPKSSNEE